MTRNRFAGAAELAFAKVERVDRPYFVRNLFTLQSYFDAGAYEAAILPQAPSEAIVPSTVSLQQTAGRVLALSASSQCPIAVEFFGKGAKTEAFILKPGQVVKPFGSDWFTEFRWGLPFGWLGGGAAYVGIAAAEDGQIWWGGGDPELMFHRLSIYCSTNPAWNTNPNWPIRFPWPNARSSYSGSAATQAGQPALAVSGTRVLARLNATLAAPATMRITMSRPDDFNDATVNWIEDVVWPVGIANPIVELGTPLAAMGGDAAIVNLVAVDAALNGVTVDFARYGRL